MIFKFDISAGNTIGRSGKPRSVQGEIRIDVNSNDAYGGISPGFNGDQESLIHQTLEECARDIQRRLERCFPLSKSLPMPGPPPTNFLEEHALEMLTLEPTWTVSMYAAFNDLGEEVTEKLRSFLKDRLPPNQLR